MRLDGAHVKELVRLLNRVSEITSEAARTLEILSGLRQILRAEVVGLMVDDDFRPGATGRIVPIGESGWLTTAERTNFSRLMLTGGCHQDPGVIRLKERFAASGGTELLTFRRDELVSDAEWAASSIGDQVRALGLDHPLYSCHPVTPPESQLLMMYRAASSPPFTAEDRELLHVVHGECGIHMRTRVSPCADANLSLSPRERSTLEALLRGDSEKEVADALGLSPHTVHQYVKSIYKAYGVRSRAELLARCFGLP